MSQRGRGCCPNCKAQYYNRYKPSKCAMCGYALGGTFEPSVKNSPGAVEIFKGIYSVKTSTRDDRCFVTTDSKMWFCSHENCKIARSVKHNSSRLTDFSCVHIDEVKLGNKCTPLSLLKPELDKFVCSVALRNSIRDILNAAELTQNIAVQVSDMMFCVLGPISASNPLGYCHVRKNVSSGFICTGKDCRGHSAKGKQVKTKSMCIHVAILLSCFVTNTASSTSASTSNVLEEEVPTTMPANSKEPEKRFATLSVAEKIKCLPYVLPHDLLQSIAQRDACTLLGSDGESWPDIFTPDMKNCQLCGSLLGDTTIHPGQSASHSGYLITELNPFKQVKILVKFCSSRSCSAMHQASVEKLGKLSVNYICTCGSYLHYI